MHLALLLLASCFHLEIWAFRAIPLSRREVVKNVKLLNDVIKYSKHGGKTGSLRMFKIDLINFLNMQYFGTVYVGSPKQRFDVLFDTGSDVFWIPGPNDTASCGNGHRKFNPEKSITYRDLHKDIHIKYVKGDNVISLANETVLVGDITVAKQTIGLTQNGDCLGHQFDGIMGMSYPNPERPDVVPVFQTMIEQYSVPSPVFSFYFNRNDIGDGGELYLGGYNLKYVDSSQIKFMPLLKSSESYWIITLKSVFVGTKLLAANAEGILDTGTSMILGPRESVELIAAAYGGVLFSDILVIECGRLEQVPTLTFNIAGTDYSYTPQDLLIHHDEDDSCILGVGVLPDDSGLGSNVWLLGDTFLSKVYSIHDYRNRMIALVPLRSNYPSGTTESPFPPIGPSAGSIVHSEVVFIGLAFLMTLLFLQ